MSNINDVLSLAKGYDVWVVDVDVAFGGDSRGHPTVAELLSDIGDLIDKISGFFRFQSEYLVWFKIVDRCVPQRHVLFGVGRIVMTIGLSGG